MPVHAKAAVALAALAFTATASSMAQQPAAAGSSAGAAAVNDFNQRVQQYVAIHKKADPGAPGQTASADKLEDYRENLRKSIITARGQVQQGAIFTPAVAAYFKRQIATTMASAEGTKIRASLRHAEPVRGLALKLNGKYPGNVPLQSTPPSLLLNLPPLPAELEYRLVDSTLVLRDKEANLIVDFLPGAISTS